MFRWASNVIKCLTGCRVWLWSRVCTFTSVQVSGVQFFYTGRLRSLFGVSIIPSATLGVPGGSSGMGRTVLDSIGGLNRCRSGPLSQSNQVHFYSVCSKDDDTTNTGVLMVQLFYNFAKYVLSLHIYHPSFTSLHPSLTRSPVHITRHCKCIIHSMYRWV